MHDAQDEKTYKGVKGNLNGDDIVKIILKQPVCAQYLVTKLYRYLRQRDGRFLRPSSSRPWPLNSRKSDYDIAALSCRRSSRRIISSSDYAFRKRIKSPMEYAYGAVRSTVAEGNELISPQCLVRRIDAMGQALFAPPNVKGWPGAQTWLSTATVLARQNFGLVALGHGQVVWTEKPPDQFNFNQAEVEVEDDGQTTSRSRSTRNAKPGTPPKFPGQTGRASSRRRIRSSTRHIADLKSAAADKIVDRLVEIYLSRRDRQKRSCEVDRVHRRRQADRRRARSPCSGSGPRDLLDARISTGVTYSAPCGRPLEPPTRKGFDMLSRRELLRRSLAPAPPCWRWATSSPVSCSTRPLAAEQGKDNILVVIEMNGGNDGLNVVMPYADDLFHKIDRHYAKPRIKSSSWTITSACTRTCPASAKCTRRANWPLHPGRRLSQSRPLAFRVDGPLADGRSEPQNGVRLARPQRQRVVQFKTGAGIPMMHVGAAGKLPLALQGSASSGAITVNNKQPYRLDLGGGTDERHKARAANSSKTWPSSRQGRRQGEPASVRRSPRSADALDA